MPGDATRLLSALRRGESLDDDVLMMAIYDELVRMARHRLASEGPVDRVQTTSLVHEVVLRLMSEAHNGGDWASRRQFFAAAAEAMRRILIERARERASMKHGGGRQRLSIDIDAAEPVAADSADLVDVLALNEALQRLEARDERMARVVKLRFFAGLTIEQTADLLDLTPRTIDRDWLAARVWLHRELRMRDGDNETPEAGRAS